MRTLLASEDFSDPGTEKLFRLLSSLFGDEAPASASYAEAEKALFQHTPQMVVVVLKQDPLKGLNVLRQLRRGTSGYLLAVGPASDSKIILQALNNGADHYLSEEDLETGLRGVLSRFSLREESSQGRVVALLSASGGCGASTLAVNMAILLVRDKSPCVLVDLKPGRGDLAALLDVQPRYNLGDVCLNAARLDQQMFEKMLAAHSCGVHLLGAPPSFSDARSITPQGVKTALLMARKLFSYVLVDLEDCFHEEQVTALKLASHILLVSRLDFTSLRNARKILEHARELGIPRGNIRVVINRHGQPGELPVDEAEDALGEKLTCFVPEDTKTFNLANNSGVPAALKFPKAKVFQSLNDVVKTTLERRRESKGFLACLTGS